MSFHSTKFKISGLPWQQKGSIQMKCECKCTDKNNTFRLNTDSERLFFSFYKASTSDKILYFQKNGGDYKPITLINNTKKHEERTETTTCCLFCYFTMGLQNHFFYIFLFFFLTIVHLLL